MTEDIQEHPKWNPPTDDKRTNAYKQYAKNFEEQHANDSKGFGDTIEKITQATGIKSLVKFVAGEDCGCDERKEKLNQMFRYPVLKCPTEDMFNFMDDYFSNPQRNDITGPQQDYFNSILTHVFQKQFTRMPCCYGGRLGEVKRIYLEYK